jgi:hypothetical protein
VYLHYLLEVLDILERRKMDFWQRPVKVYFPDIVFNYSTKLAVYLSTLFSFFTFSSAKILYDKMEKGIKILQ